MGFGIKTRIRRLLFAAKMVHRNCTIARDTDLEPLLLCHALEKGIGLSDSQPGHGKEKAVRLARLLVDRCESGDTQSYVFKESLAVLRAYNFFQNSGGQHVAEIDSALDSLSAFDTAPCEGGYAWYTHDMLTGEGFDFSAFAHSRHTMRAFSSMPVEEDELLGAVEIAARAPSACNREPWRVRYSFNPRTIETIRSAVPKQNFLKDVPYFLIVTVNKSLFNPEEINQWFINGGIFISHLVLALHGLGIGSCVLQFPSYRKEADDLRRSLDISAKEEFIAIIGFGKYPAKAKCIRAHRREVSEIAINLG